MQVGEVRAALVASFDDTGFKRFDAAMGGANEKAKHALKAQLGGQFNDEAFLKYQASIDRAKRVASDQKAFKAQLGGDYNPTAFRAYERSIDRASAQHGQMTRTVDKNNKTLSGSFKEAAKGAAAFGGAFVAFSAAKDAIETTLSLGRAVHQLTAVTGMDIKTASEWVELMKVREVQGKQVALGFVTLARQIKSAEDADSKHADAIQAVTVKQRAQIQAMKDAGASNAQIAAMEKTQAAALDVVAGKSDKANKSFKELGVSQAALKRGDVNEVLLESADGFAKIENPARRAALAQQLFGRSGRAMLPILSEGRKGVEDALAATVRYGAFLPKNTKLLEQARVSQRNLNLAMDGLKITFATAVLPSLVQGANKLSSFVQQMRTGKGAGGDFAAAVKTGFTTIKTIVGGVVTTFGGLGNTVKIVIAAFAVSKIVQFTNALKAMFLLMRTSPVGLLLTAVGLLASAFGLLSGRQHTAAVSAGEVADAWDRARTAARALRDANLQVIQAKIDHIKADQALADSQRAVTKAADDYGKKSPQYRDAVENLAQARLDDTRASNAETDSTGDVTKATKDQTKAKQDAIDTGRRRLKGQVAEVVQDAHSGASSADLKKRVAALTAEENKLNQQQADLNAGSKTANKGMAIAYENGAKAIKDAMDTGTTTVRNGIAKVNALMSEAFKALGFNPKDAGKLARSGFSVSTIAGATSGQTSLTSKPGFQRGGILPGQGREDTQLVAAAPGEGFLTRHQMKAANQGLRVARAVGFPFGSLGDIWGSIRRPHGSGAKPRFGRGYATGGMVGNLGAMVAKANEITSHHYPYLWGGGHNTAFSGPYDCSGAVSADLHAGGVLNAPMVAQQFMSYGLPGPGRATIYASPAHVYMSLMGRFFGTSTGNPGGGAAWFNGAARPGFVQRHIPVTGDAGGGIPALKVNGSGMIPMLAQGAINAVRAGANQRIGQVMTSLFAGGQFGGGDIGEGGIALPGGGGPVRAQVARILLANGFNRIGAAGVLGNIAGESNYNPAAMEPGTDNGGLFGFTAGSKSLAALRAYAAGRNQPWTDVGTQVAFALQQSDSPAARASANAAGSPSAAADAWMLNWEHPNLALAHSGVREAAAEDAFRAGFQHGGEVPGFQGGGIVGQALAGHPAWRASAVAGTRSLQQMIGEPGLPHLGGSTPTTGPGLRGVARTISGNRKLIDTLEGKFSTLDSFYSISPKDLVDPDTGLVNHKALKQRLDQLDGLLKIRRQIFDAWSMVVALTNRLIAGNKLMVRGFTLSLRAIKTKGLKGKALKSAQDHQRVARAGITQYQTALGSAVADLGAASGDRDSSWLAVLSERGERASVAGTKADASIADTAGGGTDLGGAIDTTGGGDVGGGVDSTPTPDQAAILAQAQTAAGNLSLLLASSRSALSAFRSPGDIGTGGFSNAFAAGASALPFGRAPGGIPGSTGGIAGAIDAASGGFGPPVVVQQFSSFHPADPAVKAQIAAATVDALGGQTFQQSPRTAVL